MPNAREKMLDERARMLAEIEAAMAPKVAPDYAMSFRDLLAAAKVGESTFREWMQAEVIAGRWTHARRGNNTVYWRV